MRAQAILARYIIMNPNLHYCFVLFSLLIAAVYFGKLRKSFLALFLPYLFVTLVLELFAVYLYQTYRQPTGWMSNVLNLASHIFYAYLFFSYTRAYKHKRLIIVLTSIYLTGSLTYYLSTSFFNFSNYVFAAGGILQVILSCFYFYQYLQRNDSVKKQEDSSGLWIASGVLLFYLGTTICFSLYHYILFHNLGIFNLPLYNVIPRLLSMILYACIAVALLNWESPQKT